MTREEFKTEMLRLGNLEQDVEEQLLLHDKAKKEGIEIPYEMLLLEKQINFPE